MNIVFKWDEDKSLENIKKQKILIIHYMSIDILI
jgi:hypothetical protein